MNQKAVTQSTTEAEAEFCNKGRELLGNWEFVSDAEELSDADLIAVAGGGLLDTSINIDVSFPVVGAGVDGGFQSSL